MPQTEDEVKPESFELMLTISLSMTISCLAIVFAFQELEAFGRNLYLVMVVFVAASIIGGWMIIVAGDVTKLIFKDESR